MRLSKTVVFFFILVCFFYAEICKAQDGGASSNESTREPLKPVSILLERADLYTSTVENQWFPALIEAALEFKFAALNDLIMIDPEIVGREVRGHNDLRQKPEEAEYIRAAKGLGADYVVNQKCEVSKKEVQYYAEIIAVSDGSLYRTVEKLFQFENFGAAVDDLVGSYMKELNVAQPREFARFLKMPVVGTNIKLTTTLGELIAKERYMTGVDAELLANEYRTLCEKDRSLLLAYYRGGLFFEKTGRLADASEALNILFMAIPEYTPVYIPLARIFRKNKRFDDAVRIAKLGQKRGITTTELSSELVLAYTAMGKKSEADAVFKSDLNSNPNDPFALLFNARKLNDEGKAEESLKFGDQLFSLNSNRGWAQLERGRSLAALGRKDEAIAAFIEAVSLLPSEINPIIYLGDMYKTTNQHQKALQHYEKILKRAPDNVELHISAAEMARKAGDAKKALSILYSIESRFSNHGVLQAEIGLLELSTGDSSKAKVHLEVAVRAGVENELVLSGLGILHVKDKSYDKAISVLTKVLAVSNDKDPIRAGLVVAYLKKGETESAMSILVSMKSGQNRIPNVDRMFGDAFLQNKQDSKALLYYRKEAASKNTLELQTIIAELSYKSQPPLVAKNEYLSLNKMGGGGASALYRLVVLSLRLKDIKSADEFLVKAVKSGSADVELWYEIGNEYSKLGNTSKAISAFEECIKNDPSMKTGAIELATLLQKTRKDSAAAEIYLKLYEGNPSTNHEYLLLAAQLFDKSGSTEKAKEAYGKTIEKNITDHKGRVRMAQLEFESGNFSKVLSLLENLSSAPINVEDAKLLSESFFALGKFEKAIPHLTFIQTRLPKDIRAVELLARISDTLGNYDNAVKLYIKYLSSVGKHDDYAFHIGELYEKLKNTTLAINQYTVNTRAYPDDYRNYDRLSRLYVGTGKNSEAIPILKKAVTFKEAQPDLNGLLAQALAVQGRGSEAVTEFKTYLENNKNDYDGWVKLGTLYFSQKKYDSAAEALEKAIAIKSTDVDILVKLGRSFFETKKYNQAIDILTRARNLNRSNPEVLILLAECFRASGTIKNLIQTLRDLADLDKKSFDIRVELANLLVKENRTSEAISTLEEVVLLRKCQNEFHLQLARLYEQAKNDELWFKHIDAATVCSPGNPQLNMELGRYHFNKKDYTKADGYLKKALAGDSKLHEGYYLLGMIFLNKRKLVDAIEYLKKAIQFGPDNREYRVAYAEVLYQEGKSADALKIIKPIVSQPNIPPSALKVAGLIYKAAGSVDTARQILGNAIISDPSCVECFIALADLHFENAEFSDAAKNYQKAMDLESHDESVTSRLANCFIKLKKFDQARNLLEKIIQTNPANSEAIYRLGHLYISDNQPDKAHKLMDIASIPKNGWYYLIKGELDEIEGKIDAATSAYNAALKMMPNVPEVQAGCGRINLLRKNYADAIMFLGQALAGDPENVQLYLELGKAYDGSGDLSTALELYKEVEARMVDHPEVHYYIARIYSKNNKHDAAIDALFKAIDRNKKNATFYIALGHEYRSIKEHRKAIDVFTRAAKIDETKAMDVYKIIGTTYNEINDEKKAKKYYEMYINAGGQDPKIKKLLKTK